MDLAKLYIYSQEQMLDYYLLRSKADFKKLWDNEKSFAKSHYWGYSEEDYTKKIKAEVADVKNYLRPSYIIATWTYPDKEKYYDFRISTWNESSGDIEYWHFKISQRVFELVNHKLTMHKVGPHAGY